MKIFRLSMLAFVLAVGSAVAGPVIFYPQTVDFSSVTSTTSITLPDSLYLSGVTFQYDPQGSQGTASADSSGIFGDNLGALNLIFDFPAWDLTFDYFVSGDEGIPSTCSGNDCMDVFLDGTFVSSALPAATFHYGLPAGSVTPFTGVTVYFTPDVSSFSISNISYDSTVPEPATFLVMGMGLLGLGVVKRLRRRS